MMKTALVLGVLCLNSTHAWALTVQYPLDNYAPGSYEGRVFGCCNLRHLGDDHAAVPLTPVYAIADGEIIPPPISSGHCHFGMIVIIEHTLDDGSKFVSLYGHLSNREGYRPRLNGAVQRGEIVGYVGHDGGRPPHHRSCYRPDDENGDGGTHLHFGIRRGEPVRDALGQYIWAYPGYTGLGQDVDFDAAGRPHGGLFTNPQRFLEALMADTDNDADGYTVSEGDCMDSGETPEGIPASAVHPGAEEICNYTDDNCDGTVDEGFEGVLEPCFVGIGACRREGTYGCTVAQDDIVCSITEPWPPSPETCDGADNDCNGEVDDGAAPASCDNGIFCDGEEVCADGVCALGPPVYCDDGVECTIDLCWEPARECGRVLDHEVCDDGDPCTIDRCGPLGCAYTPSELDQDRDGFVAFCAGGADCDDEVWGVNPDAEEVCDGIDNNCAAGVDENWPELGDVCYEGLGVCRRGGRIVCTADGTGTECGAEADPDSSSPEVCDGEDDDCNGSVDDREGCCPFTPCVSGERCCDGVCQGGECCFPGGSCILPYDGNEYPFLICTSSNTCVSCTSDSQCNNADGIGGWPRVCCGGLCYSGDCCSNGDCWLGYVCGNIWFDHICQLPP